MLSIKRFLVSIISAGAIAAGGVVAAAPAGAQGPPTQQGLVNIAITDTAIAIPISLAANICDVNVAVLVDQLEDAPADCRADAGNETNIEFANGGGTGPPFQQGLVNVLVDNVAVVVPIGVAANVCDVNVAVLVDDFLDQPADCRAGAVNVTSVQL
jgi:hypothetical protein